MSAAWEEPCVPHPTAHESRAGRRDTAALLEALRPRQWPKNLLVLAPALAAGKIAVSDAIVPAMAAAVIMTVVASGTYLVNDVRDRALDAAHPTKRFRPIARGAVSPRTGLLTGCALVAGGIGGAFAIGPTTLGLVVLAYAVLTVAYSFGLKAVPYLELVIVAAGFVLRAAAGGAAARVPLSLAFIAVTAGTAGLLVLGKRMAELRACAATGRTGRPVLASYGENVLRSLLVVSGIVALVSYLAWALRHGGRGAEVADVASALAAGLGVARYASLVHAGAAEAPEEILWHDRTTQLAALAAITFFTLGMSIG